MSYLLNILKVQITQMRLETLKWNLNEILHLLKKKTLKMEYKMWKYDCLEFSFCVPYMFTLGQLTYSEKDVQFSLGS